MSAEAQETSEAPAPEPDKARTRLIEIAKQRGSQRFNTTPEPAVEEKPTEEKKAPKKAHDSKDSEETEESKKTEEKMKRDYHDRFAALRRHEKRIERKEAEIRKKEDEIQGIFRRHAELEKLAEEDPVAFVEAAKISPAKFAQKWVERTKGKKLTPEELQKQELEEKIKALESTVEDLKKPPPPEPTPPPRDEVAQAVRADFESTIDEQGLTAYPTLHTEFDPEQVIEMGVELWERTLKNEKRVLDADELFELLEGYAKKSKAAPVEKPDYATRRARALKLAGKAIRESDPDKTSGADKADGGRTREKGEGSAGPAGLGHSAETSNRPSVLTNQTASLRASVDDSRRGKSIGAALEAARRLRSQR